MEVNILKEEKDTMEFEVREETHTLCNVLREELSAKDEVSFTAYTIKHPLVSSPVVIVKTKDSKPRKVVEKAVSELKSKIKELKSSIKKL